MPRRGRLLVAVLVLAGWSLNGAPVTAQRLRGVTISSRTDGRDWASDAIVPTFAAVKALGANWVTIHPWGRIHADGTVSYQAIADDASAAYLTRPIREAHALGLKIMIKPQIAYWGSPFSWPGEVAFGSDQDWERFFASYESWLLDLARTARDADALAIGTELDRTFAGAHEARWRSMIARVRALFPGPLTYAANWTDYQRVPFWDALDAIGVQAYFPLAERAGADEPAIAGRWSEIMAGLHAFAERLDRYVVFTELGYNRSTAAPLRPWDAQADRGDDDAAAAATQETCMRIALEAIEREPRVVGAFLWKWFPDPLPEGRDFQLASAGMRRVIAEVWGRYGAGSASP